MTIVIDGGVTLGHSRQHGGLRGHSVGDTYPFTVIGIGWPVQWASHNCLTGAIGTLWDSPQYAQLDAQLEATLRGLNRE